ncbi:chalcone isomerase family protein [Imbroritus primus]|uniref:chalcone isomerase family protein n=1 Tax=Imbroritus primus TaxID=3058603 RepID=UPI003D16160D
MPHPDPLSRVPALLRRLAALTILLGGMALAAPGMAAEVEGQRFDETVQLASKDLQLNGVGMRTVFLIKAYAAGLYLPEKARNAAVVLGMGGAKRLQIRPLREVEADTFIKALNEGIHKNHSEAQISKLNSRLDQLSETLRTLGKAQKGDTINFDFAPESGTLITINGAAKGKPIPGEDFYQAVLRIFIGDQPVDRDLKRGLLGN